MARKYKIGPTGIAVHPWVNKPDVKYNAEGLYHTGVRVSDQPAQDFKDEIDKLVEEAFEFEMAKICDGMTPAKAAKEREKWSKYHPYIVDEDDDGVATGYIIFNFKQNAKIRQPDGAMKPFVMGIRDAADKACNDAIYGGATIRVMWAARNAKIASANKIGVRLDFSKVQLIKPADASGGGFGEVEGGHVSGNDGAAPRGDDAAAKDADY